MADEQENVLIDFDENSSEALAAADAKIAKKKFPKKTVKVDFEYDDTKFRKLRGFKANLKFDVDDKSARAIMSRRVFRAKLKFDIGVRDLKKMISERLATAGPFNLPLAGGSAGGAGGGGRGGGITNAGEGDSEDASDKEAKKLAETLRIRNENIDAIHDTINANRQLAGMPSVDRDAIQGIVAQIEAKRDLNQQEKDYVAGLKEQAAASRDAKREEMRAAKERMAAGARDAKDSERAQRAASVRARQQERQDQLTKKAQHALRGYTNDEVQGFARVGDKIGAQGDQWQKAVAGMQQYRAAFQEHVNRHTEALRRSVEQDQNASLVDQDFLNNTYDAERRLSTKERALDEERQTRRAFEDSEVRKYYAKRKQYDSDYTSALKENLKRRTNTDLGSSLRPIRGSANRAANAFKDSRQARGAMVNEKIDLDVTAAEAKLKELRAQSERLVRDLNRGADLDLDIVAAQAKLGAVRDQMKELDERIKRNLQYDIDITAATQKMHALMTEESKLHAKLSEKLRLRIDTDAAQHSLTETRLDITRTEKEIESLNGKRVDIDASPARIKAERLRQQLRSLSADIEVGANTKEASAKFKQLYGEAVRLAALSPEIDVRLESREAVEQMRATYIKLKLMASRKIQFTVKVDEKLSELAPVLQNNRNRILSLLPALSNMQKRYLAVALAIAPLLTLVGGLSAAFGTLYVAARTAASALLILPAGILAIGAVAGTTAIGVLGLAKAYQAQSQAANEAARGTVNAANKTAKANKLTNAEINRVRNAQEAYDDAQYDANETARQYDRTVVGLNRDLADAQRTQKRSILDIALANITWRNTTRDLNRELEDLQDTLDEQNQSAEEARTNYLETRLEGDSQATRRALLDYKKALKDKKRTEEDAASTKADAPTLQQSANRDLQDAKDSGADADQKVLDAQDALTEAYIQNERAKTLQGRAIRDANEALEDARNYTDAAAEATDKYTSSQQAADLATARLSENGKKLLSTLRNLTPAAQDFQKAIQQILLEGVADRVQKLADTYFPRLTKSMGAVAGSVNGLVTGFADFLLLPSSQSSIDVILNNTAGLVKSLGGLLNETLFPALLKLAEAGSGSFGTLFDIVDRLVTRFTDWVNGQSIEQLTKRIDDALGVIDQAIGFAGELARTLDLIGSAAAIGGGNLGTWTTALKDFNGSIGAGGANRDSFLKFFSNLRTAFDEAFVKSNAIGTIGDILLNLSNLLVKIAPHIGAFIEQFHTFINTSADNGAYEIFLSTLIDVFTELFAILSRSDVQDALKKIAQGFRDLFEKLKDSGVIDSLVKALTAMVDPAIKLASQLTDFLFPILKTLFDFVAAHPDIFVGLLYAMVSLGTTLPIVSKFLTPFLKFFKSDAVAGFASKIGELLTKLKILSPAGEAGGGILKLISRLSIGLKAIPVVGWIITGLLALVDGFKEAKKQGLLGPLWERLKGNFASLKTSFQPFVDAFKTLMKMFDDFEGSSGGQFVRTVLAKAFVFIVDTLGQMIEYLGYAIQFVGALVNVIVQIVNVLVEIGKAITGYGDWSSVGKAITDGFMNGVGQFGDAILKLLYKPFENVYKNIKTFLGVASPSKLFTELGGFIVQGLINGLKDLGQRVFDAFKAVFDFFVKLGSALLNAAGDVFGWLAEKATGVKNWIVDRVKDIIAVHVTIAKRLAEAAGDVFGWLRDKASGVKDWIGDRVTDVVNFFVNLPAKIRKAAGGIFDPLGQAFVALLNFLVDRWNTFKLDLRVPDNKITQALQISGKGITLQAPVQLPRFKWEGIKLAKGGTVQPSAGGSFVNIAENNQAENVLPLVDGKYSRGEKELLQNNDAQFDQNERMIQLMTAQNVILAGMKVRGDTSVTVEAQLAGQQLEEIANKIRDLAPSLELIHDLVQRGQADAQIFRTLAAR